MNRRFLLSTVLLLTVLPLYAENPPTASEKKEAAQFKKEAEQKSPSFQQRKWTGTQGAYETNLQYDYVGNAQQNLGDGNNQNIHENYFDIRHKFMRHTLLAFLVEVGAEYQHQGFSAPNSSLVPDRLETLNADVGLDARWSEKDLLHIAVLPGAYSDFHGSGWAGINAPIDVGYTRVTSNHLQWVLGFSWNSWRSAPFLGAAGFRWQVNDRWKIKAYLPTPAVEFVARPNLTLSFGADIRGDSYRVGPHFGDSKGHPELNNALVDYQEVRVGPGFSWNIKPLIECNFMAGYMVGRQYDFHNNGVVMHGSGAPFVSIAFHALMKLPGERLNVPQRNRVSYRNIFKYF